MPLAEVVYDLFDKLKSVTSGDTVRWISTSRSTNKVNWSKSISWCTTIPCDALAFICHRSVAESRGCAIIKQLREEIPRHQFEVALQAAIGAKVIARESVRALRKDVTAKCYGGDVSRKRKLLEKQKKGKKRMKMVGNVEVPRVPSWPCSNPPAVMTDRAIRCLLTSPLRHEHHCAMPPPPYHPQSSHRKWPRVCSSWSFRSTAR